ncbi:hypothetical protein Q4Q39_09605 [Flavivirga amylovorans]|uniref:NHL repeat-containing protein n=1 Tax=Flavivirga amylovorans TaxID=870486 RepID=A0ABT8X1Q6_9FLAO|nr:hypothetical protein [Flavivirga amylovorans]MDO5987652.1 hypothetical protein [Flavivirga amylovorans]
MKTKKTIAQLCLLLSISAFSCEEKGVEEDPSKGDKVEIMAKSFNASIEEGKPQGVTIGKVEASVSSGELIYEIESQQPEGAIAINSSTGEITIADESNFSYELNQSITGMLKLSSGNTEKLIDFIIYIREVKTIEVTTITGHNKPGFVNGNGSSVRFNIISSICLDKDDNIYITEFNNHCIRKITPEGTVTTIAGTGVEGFVNGKGDIAQFSNPQGIDIDAQGNLYVSDAGNDAVRKITPDGNVSTFAGGEEGHKDGIGTEAQFVNLEGLTIDDEGNVYVADVSTIRKITPSGEVTTLAGAQEEGYADGKGTNARFYYIFDIDIDSKGNLYACDARNEKIRKITPSGEVSTAKMIDDKGDSIDQFTWGIALNEKDEIYVASDVFTIHRLYADGFFPIVAGKKGVKGGVDGGKEEALLKFSRVMALDSKGDIIFADPHKLRKVSFK